ncbi:alpha-N-acetylgalactosaminide alpha-2,6-sialyltransferase 5 isoform X4 [Rhipicephalus microplus]|uniref:alpha-N-acetylgalactosaminide alpha-2,6-sialyltransferase 5 isoform X4 n=1 Tax=Rhipicephalus microplus TaxID=6941 RepID=UPI003F6AC5E5
MVRLCRRCLVPAVLVLACLLCTLQMLAALVGTAEDTKRVQAQKAHRLRPRHVGGEPDVRGRTYQRHMAEPLDARHRELHSERLRLNRLFRPHLVARRQIFSADSASHFLGESDEHSQRNFSCGTCALVGYSGHLLNSAMGDKVDASDCVIRLGRSPGRGYDGDVGSKTTFRLMHADIYQLSGAEPSTLWHAVKLVETLGCQSLKVFGVPEPKLCKRQRDEPSRSRFWEYSSPPQCTDGVDVGHNEDPLKPDPAHLSLVDRRAMAGWLQSAKRLDVRFLAPTWSVFKHASSAT